MDVGGRCIQALQNLAEQTEELLATCRLLALHAIGNPVHIGSMEQIEIRPPLEDLPFDLRRARAVVVATVDEGAHEVGVMEDERGPSVDGSLSCGILAHALPSPDGCYVHIAEDVRVLLHVFARKLR
jgi:hypothetical protein